MLSFLNKNHPKKGFVYAIVRGKYAGQLFVYVESRNDQHEFLSLPEMVIRCVPTSNFDFGINNRIIDIVEKLPSNVYKICVKQYRKNKLSHK